MNRYLLTLLSLFAVAFWLCFSYAPPAWGKLPQLAFPPTQTLDRQWLAALALALFLAVQGLILWSTARLRPAAFREPLVGGRRLYLAAELFWTALPLLLTVGLALLSYGAWRSLSS